MDEIAAQAYSSGLPGTQWIILLRANLATEVSFSAAILRHLKEDFHTGNRRSRTSYPNWDDA